MVNLAKSFNKISSSRVLVVGDLMVDAYTFGKAKRVSPEAPVAVIHVKSEEKRPGGAGNVVLNLVSMGAKVKIMGRIGNDSMGKELKEAFVAEGVGVEAICVQEGYDTPVKNRIIADTQQVLRIDRETTDPLPEPLEAKLIETLPSVLEGVDVVAISDYGKGFLTDGFLEALIQESTNRGIPTIVDPKGIRFQKYRGATWIKPNLSEAYAAANMPFGASLDEVALKIFEQTEAHWLMITRSEEGISLFERGSGRKDFPVVMKEIKDVTGAGDTVLAMLTMAIANRFDPAEGCALCNIAAGIAIEKLGCARVGLKELAHRLLENNVAHKIFHHDEQIDILEDLLKHGGYQVLKIPSASGLTSSVFRQIRTMRKESDSPLLVQVEDIKPDDEMVNILADLHEVDFVIAKPAGIERLMVKSPPLRIEAIKVVV